MLLIGLFEIFLKNDIHASEITSAHIIRSVNSVRQAAGLSLLKENSRLNQAAKIKALDMLKGNYWSHINPTTGANAWGFIKESGYNYSFAGENLARLFSTTEDMVNAWLNSPSHKANIYSRIYRDTGVAVVETTVNTQRTVLVVQLFGTIN